MSAVSFTNIMLLFTFVLAKSEPSFAANKTLSSCVIDTIESAVPQSVTDSIDFQYTNRGIDEIFDELFNKRPPLVYKSAGSAIKDFKKRNLQVLDIGCGKGRAVLDLRDRGVAAYG